MGRVSAGSPRGAVAALSAWPRPTRTALSAWPRPTWAPRGTSDAVADLVLSRAPRLAGVDLRDHREDLIATTDRLAPRQPHFAVGLGNAGTQCGKERPEALQLVTSDVVEDAPLAGLGRTLGLPLGIRRRGAVGARRVAVVAGAAAVAAHSALQREPEVGRLNVLASDAKRPSLGVIGARTRFRNEVDNVGRRRVGVGCLRLRRHHVAGADLSDAAALGDLAPALLARREQRLELEWGRDRCHALNMCMLIKNGKSLDDVLFMWMLSAWIQSEKRDSGRAPHRRNRGGPGDRQSRTPP